jgi:ornithine cyclodeaminase/alanine dehydrogenase-like protein (mu-crystallin family)
MKVLVVSQAEVARLLPMPDCIEAMSQALLQLARGEAAMPLRQVMRLEDRRAAMAAMPAYVSAQAALGIKVITVYPDNPRAGYDSHQGAVLLFEAEHGSLRAIVDAAEVTAIRTAAVSAVATRALARPDARDLAILGSGVQARTHLEAMLHVRPIERVRVWSRTPEHARAFAQRESKRHDLEIEPAGSARGAVKEADIICTVTASRQPILKGDWIAPGAHINAVGSSVPSARELDAAAVKRARLFVDRRESALAEAGDFLLAKAEGAVGDDHIQGELGEVLLGTVPGRRSPDEITLFKSLGLAVEDLAAVQVIAAKAAAQNAGVWVELSGNRSIEGRA